MATSKKAPEPQEDPDVAAISEEFVEEEVWAFEPAGPGIVARMVAEALGAFALVLLGVGTALFIGAETSATLTVSLAFGIVVMVAVVAIGHISGAHLNPAVTLGVWIAGRFPGRDVGFYWIAQVLGGALGAAALVGIVSSHPQGVDIQPFMSQASIGYGDHSPLGFGLAGALIVEAVATALLVAIVLAATSVKALKGAAPFAIGLGLTVLIIWAMPFTNAGLNPARATATAIFSEPWALQQLWVFWVAPLVGAAIVGLLYRAFSSDEEFELVEVVETIKD